MLTRRVSGQSVALIIKEVAENAGLDKNMYSGRNHIS